MRFTLFVLLLLFIHSPLQATPFPVKGEIFDGNNKKIGTAHVYPRYVEIFNKNKQQIGRVGILVEKGLARLFMVRNDNKKKLVGYANNGKIFDLNDKIKGQYFWTPTYSFVYYPNGARAGKVKCIAWPRVCAVGVGGYLLNLFEEEK